MPKDAVADPDRLVRQRAGTYRTQDERFEVRESDTGWFVLDSAETNEFGQPLMHGPFATLKVAREAIPGARKTKPLPRGGATRAKAGTSASGKRTGGKEALSEAKAKPQPAPPPRSWIDELSAAEGREVRSLIRALEAEGFSESEAEALVRRDRDGLLPAVATSLIERRLDALVADLPPTGRDLARDLVRRAAEVLAADGTKLRSPLPRWTLVELKPDEGEPRNRRIDIGRV